MEHKDRLTSAEMAALWSSYMSDTMAICMLQHFSQHVDDAETRQLIEHGTQLAKGHIETVTQVFGQENFPIPVGFTAEDVNLSAPRLFSDAFYLHYLDAMVKVAMVTYTAAVASATRKDIRAFYSACLSESNAMLNQCSEILEAKGMLNRAPFISTPDNVDFVKKQSFLTGFFGSRRTLNAMEITNLHMNFQRAAISKVTTIAFAQVAQSQKVRQHMERGSDIKTKHIKVFSDILLENDLSTPSTLDSEITDSTTHTFSDKLMMFHLGSLTAAAIGNYGVAIGSSLRRDLALTYTRLMAEAGLYHEDGANIAIANGWIEEPPQADNRKELAEQH